MPPYFMAAQKNHPEPVIDHISKISLSNKGVRTPLTPVALFPLSSQPRHRIALSTLPSYLLLLLRFGVFFSSIWLETSFNSLASLEAAGWSVLIV